MSLVRELRKTDVAAQLEISTATLDRWIADGKAPPSYKRGQRRLFPADGLKQWLDEQRAAAK